VPTVPFLFEIVQTDELVHDSQELVSLHEPLRVFEEVGQGLVGQELARFL